METILKRKYKIEHKQRIEIIDKSEKHNIFASCSLDGLIKLWDTDKVLIAEIKLDDTLSYCRFCNVNGDLLCGWRNHLFKIVLKRGLIFKKKMPINV
jgi:WD40 repeat protein